MTKAVRGIFYISVALQCLLFLGCSPNNNGDLSGIEGTGSEEGDLIAARGAVTQFGSIYVNGIHFNTDTATFYQDGIEINEEALKQGMVVYVEGTQVNSDSSAVASEVHFDYLLQGRIEQISTLGSNQRQIQMLGHNVILSEDAMLAIDLFDSLKEGDIVAISGLTESESSILATRIDLKESNVEDSVIGYVNDYSEAENHLQINSMDVDISAAILSGNGELANGALVKVSGIQSSAGTFTASEVKLLRPKIFNPPSDLADRFQKVSDEGLVESVNSTGNFVLDGRTVHIEGARWSGPGARSLAPGNRVSVTGSLNESGDIVASSLHVHPNSENHFSGEVSDVDLEEQTITISGIIVQINRFTRFEDWGSRRNRYFGIQDIRAGDVLDVFVRNDDQGSSALTIRRKPEQPAFQRRLNIKGAIESYIEGNRFTIAGIAVDISHLMDLGRLEDGMVVVVEGKLETEGLIVASKVLPIPSGCTSHREDFCQWQHGPDKDRDELGPGHEWGDDEEKKGGDKLPPKVQEIL